MLKVATNFINDEVLPSVRQYYFLSHFPSPCKTNISGRKTRKGQYKASSFFVHSKSRFVPIINIRAVFVALNQFGKVK
jgi:hypothetical protein